MNSLSAKRDSKDKRRQETTRDDMSLLSERQRDQLDAKVVIPCLESEEALQRKRRALKAKKRRKKFVYNWFGRKKKPKSDGREYWAEALREMRLNVECELVFRVKWENYSERENTWQSAKDLFKCDALYRHLYERLFNDRHVEFYSRPDLTRLKDILRMLCSDHADLGVLLAVNDLSPDEFNDRSEKGLKELKRPLEQLRDAAVKQLMRKTEDDDWPTRLLVLHVVQELHVFQRFQGLDAFLEFCSQRQDLQKRLDDWTRDFGDLVHVENLLDADTPPEVTFVSEYRLEAELRARLTPTWSKWACDCDDDCTRTKCVCALRIYSEKRAYRTSHVVYECHASCRCHAHKCPNRRIQRGSRVRLTVGKTREKGWGLFARQNLKFGDFVMEYSGEVLDSEGAGLRDATYFFNLNQEFCGRTLFVDGKHLGNATRFANHSCAPNLDVHLAVCSPEESVPRIAFFAKRDIKSGEELSYDYNRTVLKEDIDGQFKDRDDRSDSGYRSEDDARRQATTRRHSDAIACFCSAKDCQKFI